MNAFQPVYNLTDWIAVRLTVNFVKIILKMSLPNPEICQVPSIMAQQSVREHIGAAFGMVFVLRTMYQIHNAAKCSPTSLDQYSWAEGKHWLWPSPLLTLTLSYGLFDHFAVLPDSCKFAFISQCQACKPTIGRQYPFVASGWEWGPEL